MADGVIFILDYLLLRAFSLRTLSGKSDAVGGEGNAVEVKIVKEGSFLHMAETGYGTERDNLDEPDAEDIQRNEADEEIARRLRDGESYRTIAKEMGVSQKTINKVKSRISAQANE
ncbi:MAG: helix-turn-helix domain-containing protein [Muribaculaceae bacterium]